MVFFSGLLAGCQSIAPQYSPVYHPTTPDRPAASPATIPTTTSPKEAYKAPATVVPVKAKTAITSLASQGREQLQQGRWRETIVLAERGLRVDRREAEFYWLIARSYLGLNNADQAAQFARQGLRYAPRGSGLYQQLQQLLLNL